jgi:hypothetical protein
MLEKPLKKNLRRNKGISGKDCRRIRPYFEI